jgi:hypothetical protein
MDPNWAEGGRFWSKVTKGDGCWLWTGSTTRGYGTFSLGGGPKYAHRISYELALGAVPDGMGVLHRCDTPLCVRPEHLFVGTRGDNARDAASKGRMRKKLSPEQTREIISLRKGGATLKGLATTYGVNRSSIVRIINGSVRNGVRR